MVLGRPQTGIIICLVLFLVQDFQVIHSTNEEHTDKLQVIHHTDEEHTDEMKFCFISTQKHIVNESIKNYV